MTGSNITVKTGTTPFGQTSGGGQVTITQVNAAGVPKVAALNGETFSVAQGSTSYTFQFVNTSNAANKAAAGRIAVNFNSTTATIGAVAAAMVAAIDNAFQDRTIFVNKSAPSGGTGAIAAPYTTISAALAAASSDAQLGLHDIVRIEGNNTGDLAEDQSYNIGTSLGQALSDGATMVVPRDTTVMIDAGAVFKLYGANIQVGSSDVNVNLSGDVAAGARHAVWIRSISPRGRTVRSAQTNNPITTAAEGRRLGRHRLRNNDLDIAYDATTPPPAVPRPDPEANGIFLDYVNDADLLVRRRRRVEQLGADDV